MATETLRVPTQDDRRFLGHPVGLATLFFTEAWERFSYYGMRALLVLFLTATVVDGGLGMSTTEAVQIYGVYSAMVYLLAVPGGWIADRLSGPRKAVLVGGAIIAIGHYTMAVPVNFSIWPGLILIAIGTGLLKPNISAMVGLLYNHDPDGGERRDSGFSIYYMGINIGGFTAPFVCGFLAAQYGWHYGFAAAGIGMTIALVIFIIFAPRTLGPIGVKTPDPASPEVRRKLLRKVGFWFGVVIIALLVDVAMGTFQADQVIILLVLIACVTPLFYFAKIFRNPNLSTVERSRMRAYIWIFVGAVMFWMIFDQGGSVLSLFAENNTSRMIGSYQFPASWLQSVDPIGIILFAPVFALLWLKLGKRAPTLGAKFALAIALIGISFLVMAVLGNMASTELVAWGWLVMVFFLQVIAELLLSPTGLSASTQLAPRNMESQVLALWFLAVAVGDAIGGQVGRLQPVLGDAGYFALLGGAAVLLAIIFATQIKRIHTLMGGIH